MTYKAEAEQLNNEFNNLFSRLTTLLNNVKEERDFGEALPLFESFQEDVAQCHELLDRGIKVMSNLGSHT
ncbi:MAG TPA: hypothetical protein EYM96_09155 [Rhodospirillales bacterium]|nr:hypothetical protein [Rhodospirillales bacterium]